MSAVYEALTEWLSAIRKDSGKDLFAVGEYLNMDSLSTLRSFVSNSGESSKMHVFDFPLHKKFYEASVGNGGFDMASLFEGTLLASRPDRAVTFVDNHDTQPCQAFGWSAVKDWFKPLAYGFILMNKDGYPNLFYPDYYGMKYQDGSCKAESKGFREALDTLLALRRDHAFGEQQNYGRENADNSADVVGITRDGGQYSKGLALVINDSKASSRWMQINKKYAGQRYCDVFAGTCVELNKDGWADFPVGGGALAVYIAEADAKKYLK